MVGIPKVRSAVLYRLGESPVQHPAPRPRSILELTAAQQIRRRARPADGRGAAAEDRQQPDDTSQRSNQLVTVSKTEVIPTPLAPWPVGMPPSC